jgi:Ca-activated chloride channel family protein
MNNRYALILAPLAALFLASLACGRQQEPTPIPTEPTGPAPFRIVAASEVKLLEDAGIFADFTRATGIPLSTEYRGSVEIKLRVEAYAKDNPGDVDAFWTASPIWMPGSLVREKTSVMRTYVVFGVDPALADDLGWETQAGITLADVEQAINAGRLHLAMPSASQDDAGANFYLAVLTGLKGTGEAVVAADLSDPDLLERMKAIFSVVSRSSSHAESLRRAFVEDRLSGSPQFNSFVLPESMAIATNQELVVQGAAPMTVFYIEDAVGIQNYTLGYVAGISDEQVDQFSALVQYLRSPEVQAQIQALGFRTGYVGMKIENPDPAVFDPDWGINTQIEFSLTQLPKDQVISLALNVYQLELRLGSYTAYCLDFSPSMDGSGREQLLVAMRLLLDQTAASRYLLQASPRDTTTAIMFDGGILAGYTAPGNDAGTLMNLYGLIENQSFGNATNIYGCAITALEDVDIGAAADQLPAVILLTDGMHNTGADFDDLEEVYRALEAPIPIFSVLMGSADESQLAAIADLTNGDVCDGRGGEEDLVRCFRTFRGSN